MCLSRCAASLVSGSDETKKKWKRLLKVYRVSMIKNYSYSSVLIVGMGLIGSSIARSLKENKIAEKVYALDNNEDIINTTHELKIVDDIKNNIIVTKYLITSL